MAEDDKDQTISSSSSESESLAHLVLRAETDDESMSSDDEGDDMVVLYVLKGKGERGNNNRRRSPRVFIICRERGGLGRLSDPPIDQTISVPSDRNLLDIYASPPHPSSRIPHHLGPALLQHDPVSLYGFQRRWHRDARTLSVANLIVVIGAPCEQIPPVPTRSRTVMRFECEQHMPIRRYRERVRRNRL